MFVLLTRKRRNSTRMREVFATLYRRDNMAAGFFPIQLGNNILVAAEERKSLLHIWLLNSQEEVHNVMVLSGPASSIAISPDDCYLAVAMDTKLFVWHRNLEKLLTVQDKHLFKITCIRFSVDADYLITASESGKVMTYNFRSLIMKSEIGQIEPLYSLADHVKAVTDVHIGNFQRKSCLVTASLDGTCRIYNLFSGQLLLQVIHNEPLTSVVMDKIGWNLFLGTDSGLISQFSPRNTPKTLHISAKENNKLRFEGHKGKVNRLCLNYMNHILISGSDDFLVIVWDVNSRQILKKIEYNGAVYNIKVIGNENFKPQLVLKDLQQFNDSDLLEFDVSVNQKRNIMFSDEDNGKEAAKWERTLVALSSNVTNAKHDQRMQKKK